MLESLDENHIITSLFPITSSFSRTAKKVSIQSEFRNKNWFPLTKKEMKLAAVDTALEELTRSNLIEIVTSSPKGSIKLDIVLVEKAATGKITITFKAKGVSSIITTASISLDKLKGDQIYSALEKMGRLAGVKMKSQLIKVISSDDVDKSLDKLIGKDWDNIKTEKLFNKAQELKRSHQFKESKRLFLMITKRTDKGSQQWNRLSQDELRITKVQEAIDNITMMKSMLGKAYQQSLRSYIRNIQISIFMGYAETGKVPTFKKLERYLGSLLRSVEILDYKVLLKEKKFSFIIKSKKTNAKAKVFGHAEDRGNIDISFF
ncbi:MAG: hypothetical protein HN576_09740 [Bacteriovoracaceae bacterium]|jgi:hypothetical protein|nr:hypothetical protein [Bacteriovoracaceae bacterium]